MKSKIIFKIIKNRAVVKCLGEFIFVEFYRLADEVMRVRDAI